jgi:hypothetical protein
LTSPTEGSVTIRSDLSILLTSVGSFAASSLPITF